MKSLKTPLMERDWKIVEKSKWFFIVSGFIVLIGLILALTIKPVVGIEFTGGYTLEAKFFNDGLTLENRDEKAAEFKSAIEGMKGEDGNAYGIKVKASDIKFQGKFEESDAFRSMYITFKSVASDQEMQDVIIPDLEKKLYEMLKDDADPYALKITAGGNTSAAISTELMWTAVAAIIAAAVCMLIYVMFRFELTSGLAAIVALLHDVAMMFAFMVIFRVEITSTFIAALVAILGYSINNTLVVFDRIRENMRDPLNQRTAANKIVNNSLRDTFGRSLNTTITTLFTITILALLGVTSIKIFAFPIIIGLLSGAYSSFCIAPSIYALVKTKNGKKKNTIKSTRRSVKN